MYIRNMKKVKVDIQDILMVLEAMAENGTKDVIFGEHNGLPSICDADEQDNIVTFQTFDSDEQADESEQVH